MRECRLLVDDGPVRGETHITIVLPNRYIINLDYFLSRGSHNELVKEIDKWVDRSEAGTLNVDQSLLDRVGEQVQHLRQTLTLTRNERVIVEERGGE